MNSPLHSPLPYADVADDFKEALSGLKQNNRFEIENLTVIARENTEHASAISRVIENHIKAVAAYQKLPAFYVLDSIVKNVGSPYNILLGRNLFSTFMGAYSLVDDRTRTQMEQMLHTWTKSVPGSMDPKPVFPTSTTGVIDNALRSAKASNYANRQQSPAHGLPPRPPVPGSPQPSSWGAPPLVNAVRYPPPPPSPYAYNGYPQATGYPQMNGYHQQPPTPQQYYQPPPSQNGGYHTPVQAQAQYYPPAPQTPQHAPPQFQRPYDYVKMHADIEGLINTIQHKQSASPHDQSLNARLKAMFDLKMLIQTSQPAPHEWDRIRDQLRLLMQQENSPPYNTYPYTQQAPAPTQFQRPIPPLPQPPTPSQAPAPQPAAPPSLADLIKNLPQQRTVTPTHNQMFAPPPPPPPASTRPAANTPQLPVPPLKNNLLEMLQKSGLVSTPAPNSRPTSAQPMNSVYPPPPPTSQSTAPSSTATAPGPPVQPSSDLAALLASLSQPKPAQFSTKAAPTVELTTASIKLPRPDLINQRLYKAAPSQCMTCGRRFPATAEGKARKARHLDFHFRMNQRVAEAEGNGRRGVCRAWYMSEREWIKNREIDDADENAVDRERAAQANGGEDGHTNGVTEGEGKQTAAPYVRVPDAGAIQASERAGQPLNVCPICQEKFENRWHDEAQEWVWMDAVKAGGQGRIYHASCYDEVKRDQEKAEKRRMAGPEAGVGVVVRRKRKMEEDDIEGGATKSPRRDSH